MGNRLFVNSIFLSSASRVMFWFLFRLNGIIIFRDQDDFIIMDLCKLYVVVGLFQKRKNFVPLRHIQN